MAGVQCDFQGDCRSGRDVVQRDPPLLHGGAFAAMFTQARLQSGHGMHEQLTEDDECHPLTLYAECKLHVENLLDSIADPNFETIIFRNATVFGLSPPMRFDLAINIVTL